MAANASRFAIIALVAAGCSEPSKSVALDVIKRDVREDATCALPVTMLSQLKLQYTTKAACAPIDAPAAAACLDALAAAGVTKAMPASYMVEWPDEVSRASFDAISPYDRRARSLVFKNCVELRELRAGGFRCGEAQAEKVVKITKNGESEATVRYTRALTLGPSIAPVEAACGAVTRPPLEGTVTLEKIEKKWTLRAGSGELGTDQARE